MTDFKTRLTEAVAYADSKFWLCELTNDEIEPLWKAARLLSQLLTEEELQEDVETIGRDTFVASYPWLRRKLEDADVMMAPEPMTAAFKAMLNKAVEGVG